MNKKKKTTDLKMGKGVVPMCNNSPKKLYHCATTTRKDAQYH